MYDWQHMPNSTCPPWAYVASDRSILDANATILDMGFKVSDFPLVAGYGIRRKGGWAQVVDALLGLSPRPQIAIVEAFQDLCESPRRSEIHNFMHWVDCYCTPTKEFPQGLTVLGMCGNPKQSMHSRYPDPTQRVPGNSIWVERASTIFVIESSDSKALSLIGPERRMFVCRKVGPRLELSGAFTPQNRLFFPNF